MLQLGRETTVQALGKTWTVGRLTLAIFRQFAAWIQANEGDPFAGLEERIARFKLILHEEDWRKLSLEWIKEAEKKREALIFLDLDAPLVQWYLGTVLGNFKMLQLGLAAHHADVTDEQAWDIFAEIGMEKAKEVLAEAGGKLPDLGNAGAHGQPAVGV